MRINEKLRQHWLLIIILSGSFLIKLAILLKLKHMILLGDEVDYLWHGLRIARGDSFETKELLQGGYVHFNPSHWGPGYIYFIGIILRFFNEKVFMIKLVQVILSTISVYLIYILAKKIFNESIALLSAFIFSIYPTLIAFTHYLWSETLYIFLLVIIIFFLIVFSLKKNKGYLLMAGIVLGLASLVKSVIFYFLPLIVFWLFLVYFKNFKAFLISSTVFLIACASVITPWTLRNYYTYGRFLLVDTNAGTVVWYNLNFFDSENYDWGGLIGKKLTRANGREKCNTGNVVDDYRCELKNGIKFIIKNPSLFIKGSVTKLCDFWNPTSFLIRHMRAGYYGVKPGLALARVITLVTVGSYIGVIIFGIFGFFYSKNDLIKVLFLFLIFYYILIHMVMFGMSRYRLPIEPFIMVYASYAILNFKVIMKNIFKDKKWLSVTAAVLLFAVMWYRYFPALFDIFG
ncbi:MAG: hypothetical protein A2042_03375 [Candidatus Schekmanbacteria bacterium GWA2_38_11]|uniref:Glycosyltransferase RgtA/B/C/D-like domain-containing protein n=1 Tax=Candidatus Schekmanbacteria bacterium GWA2_38_11 TaxID=1817876 RepID=A0A1F7RAM4_9BACT|nr:MAG: hypothetical protein A2042_03375 [Candidatus Schekmanbacteria bacterium GWA2_38_11]